MPQSDYLPRMVNLERRDHEYIWQIAEQRALGKKGFSLALRQIIREHQADHDDEQPEPEFVHPPFP